MNPAFELFSRPDKSIFLMLRMNELRLGAVLRPMLSFAQREGPKHLGRVVRNPVNVNPGLNVH